MVKVIGSNPSFTASQLGELGNSLTSLTLSFLEPQMEIVILTSHRGDENQIIACDVIITQ